MYLVLRRAWEFIEPAACTSDHDAYLTLPAGEYRVRVRKNPFFRSTGGERWYFIEIIDEAGMVHTVGRPVSFFKRWRRYPQDSDWRIDLKRRPQVAAQAAA